MAVTRKKMPETMYRASRCCRILGNPTAYLTLKTLARKRKSPSEMSDEMGISRSALSVTLRHLRQVDLVRYETYGKNKVYWIKDIEILNILKSIEKRVDVMRKKTE